MDKIALIFTLDEVFQTASEPQREILQEQMQSIAGAMTASEIYSAMLLSIQCMKDVSVAELDAEISGHFGDDIDEKLKGLIQWIDEGDSSARPTPHPKLH